MMTALVFLSIVLRLVLGWASPAWDESARYVTIWMIMAGAIVTSRQDEHITMGYLSNILRTEKQRLLLSVIITGITFLFLCVFTVWTFQFISFSVERGLRSVVTNIPMLPMHLSFFVGVVLSTLHFLIHTIRKSHRLINYVKAEDR
jgi:TRAP-type C4-dicarboxylate transport system permease small subunit